MPDTPDTTPEPEPEPEPQHTCCSIRRKVLVGVLKVLSERECGVSDAELADVIRFDLNTPSGKPVLAFRYCPWCGIRRGGGAETRVTDVGFADPDDGDGGSLES